MEEPLWKKVWQYFRMLNIHLSYDLVVSFLGSHPAKIKIYDL